MNCNDTYQSEYFAADLLEWDDAPNSYGICTRDYRETAMGADTELTCEEYLFEFGLHTIDGRDLDGFIVVPASVDIVSVLTRLDRDFEQVASEIDEENRLEKIYG